MALSKQDQKLLEDLFSEFGVQPDGVNAARFRAKREDQLADIDALVRDGFIERKDKLYWLGLLALSELAETNSRAESLLYLCSHIFKVVRAHYVETPETPLPLAHLAKVAEQPEPLVRKALRYLIQFPIWAGYSSDTLAEDDAYVMPGESVLKYKTLDACIAQLREWSKARGHANATPFSSPDVAQFFNSVHDSLDSIEDRLLNAIGNGQRSFSPSSQKSEDIEKFQLVAKTLDYLFRNGLIQSCKVLYESQSGKKLAAAAMAGDLTFEGERHLAQPGDTSGKAQAFSVSSRAKRKYQIFISSTFKDLQDERQAAVEAILLAGHIPAGMELFSAGDESQLHVIKQWISESDIYMLILGNRYGSIEPKSQLSYTELEYDHAMSLSKPLFALVLSDAAIKAKSEADPEANDGSNPEKLAAFKEKVLSKISRYVDDQKDIKLHTVRSIQSIETKYKLSGWVRVADTDGRQQ